MSLKATLFVLLAYVCGHVVAQACPEVNVRVYGVGDTTCGGTSQVMNLQNLTYLQVPGGFSSVQPGHPNDPAWDGHCVIFTTTGNSGQLTSGFTSYTGFEDFDPICKGTRTSDGLIPDGFLMICARDGGPSDCPNGGGGTTPPTTTMPPSTTTDPTDPDPTDDPTTLPINTTPSPTDTSVPNTEIQDAISTASSAISVASEAAAALAASPTDQALADTAEEELYDALALNQEANNLAQDYSANELSSDLDTVDNNLETAALAAVAAAAALSLAAANELLNTFNDVKSALQVAAANAADPVLNPRPARPRPQTSRRPAPPCTLSIAQIDSRLAEPTPSLPDLPAGASITAPAKRGTSTFPPSTQAALPAVFEAIRLSESHTLADAIEDTAIEFLHSNFTSTLLKRQAGDFDRGMYCGVAFGVPAYSSYGRMQYLPLYSYNSDNMCADFRWNFQSAQSAALLPLAPVGYNYPSNEFATEHIFEIQQVKLFLEYARQSVPLFQQLYPNDNGNQFCNSFFANQLNAVRQFAAPGIYDYSSSPLQQVYNALEGSVASNVNRNNEFVYLESKVNRLKATYFAGFSPASSGSYLQRLAKVTRAAIMAEYLQNNNVVAIYQQISNRIRQEFVNFGRACADPSADPSYQQFGDIDWASVYDQWEQNYLAGIEDRLQRFVTLQITQATGQIRILLRLPEQTVPLAQKQRLMRLRTGIMYARNTKLRAGDLSLAKLRGGI